jgi:hypothetical protein
MINSKQDITRTSVLEAMAAFDALGRKAFLKKHHYGASSAYRIRHERRLYDSKAILGVAYGIEHGCDPLRPSDFSGGAEHCARLLARLGFTVLHRGAKLSEMALSSGLRLLARVRRTVANLSLKSQAYLVGLVGCGKAKLKEPAPARALYTSPGFRMALAIAEKRCDETLILSAEYGVVEPSQVIAPYDKTLSKMPKRERLEWASRIQACLKRRFDSRRVRYLVLAGAAYASAVTGMGCEVDDPMRGQTQGQRMAWLSAQTRQSPAVHTRAKSEIADRRIRYFLPDAQDFVPSFDYERETRDIDRVRQRDDRYVHEVFAGERVHDGVLLSKAIVESTNGGAGKFSQAQRLRLYREGIQGFYRLGPSLASMGDCGAFSYIDHESPPFSVDETAEFYESCGVDYGISTDHVIKAYRPDWDGLFDGVPAEVRQRQELTLELAQEFWTRSKGLRYTPLGVAQGWSPSAYAKAVQGLQAIGYSYIALGGVVPLKNDALLEVVRAVGEVRRPSTRFHLLGVARPDHLGAFQESGVASFDSTSPLRQAWTDRHSNYHTATRAYAALRIPQVGSNPKLKRRIEAGEVSQSEAFEAEREALRQVGRFHIGKASVGAALRALVNYEAIHSPDESRADDYRTMLEDAPWKRCLCTVCQSIGHHVALFRGSERNRMRGFHNVRIFYKKVTRANELGL